MASAPTPRRALALGFGFVDKPELGRTGLDQQLAYYERYLRWTARGVPPPRERPEARRPARGPARAAAARLVHREESLRANVHDGLTALMREAGFADAAETAQRASLFGALSYYRAA